MLGTAERMAFDARFAVLNAVDPQLVIAKSERHAFTLDKVGEGGVLRIAGEVFVVQKTATYAETNEKGTKERGFVSTELVLFSLKTGETRYLEWSLDDHLDISFTERKLSKVELNSHLRDDEGASFDVDEDIDECADNEWSLRFNGKEYPYDDDWTCRFSSSDGRQHVAHLYEFGSDEVGWLTIEAWQDGKGWEYEGYLSHSIPSNAIEVISTGQA
jgi:hypothetical protein